MVVVVVEGDTGGGAVVAGLGVVGVGGEVTVGVGGAVTVGTERVVVVVAGVSFPGRSDDGAVVVAAAPSASGFEVAMADEPAATAAAISRAGAGSTISSSTTETPAHATATAVQVAMSQRATNPICFMDAVSPGRVPTRVKGTLNGP